MPTLTVRNVPAPLYERLKRRAAAHRRSLTQEAIAVLEEATQHQDPRVLLAEVDTFREGLAARGVWATDEEVERWINEGRE